VVTSQMSGSDQMWDTDKSARRTSERSQGLKIFNTTMRNALAQLIIFALAIPLITGPAYAQNYNLPWCAIADNDGNLNCAYDNEQQCLTTLSGIGGQCVQNPSPPTPALAPSAPFSNANPGPPPRMDPGPPPGLDSSTQQQIVPNNLFTAAGFTVKYATTPEKREILRSLPPDKLVTRRKDGKLYYVYADAARCNCAYVGTPQAYAAYQNGGIDPNFGGGNQQLTTMQILDSDAGPPGMTDIFASGMDSILDPRF
jgi:hypothetical protein